MNAALCLLLAGLAPLVLGMGRKPGISVRFFAEANAQDTDKFATPIALKNPPRAAYIEKVSAINEKMVKAIYPFQAKDGTWGCAFKLDDSGRMNLELVSTEHRGSSMVAFVGTKAGTHQVIDMLIDKPIRDGIISIPSGLTELEIAAFTKEFPVLGQQKQKSFFSRSRKPSAS